MRSRVPRDSSLVSLMRSEEHTSELSHGYISYAVFCLKKKMGSAHGIAEFKDLAWRSFVIQDDFKVNKHRVNVALDDYLGKIFSFYVRVHEAYAHPIVHP